MSDRNSVSTRRWLFVAWLLSGAATAISMLIVWPFPVELQLTYLFAAFATLALLSIGYRKPIRPLAFLIGGLLPYVVVQLWFGALVSNDGGAPEEPTPPGESAAEEPGK